MLSRYRDTFRVWTDPVGHALYRLHLRPNHLTLAGLGVSVLAAAAFVAGRTRAASILLLLAGLFDFFDGSLARASRQVTPFGAFLDSVIDRYSDLVVLLGIVVLFARMPHARGAAVAMAALVGTVMVSYTKARAESIGVECNVGVMERPERLICLIAGGLLGLLEPALWVLAVLANLTALQRIAYTRRAVRDAALLSAMLAALLLPGPARAEAPPGQPGPPADARPAAPSDEQVRAWAEAVAEFQAGLPRRLIQEFSTEAALSSPIADHVRFLLADALARVGDLGWARAMAASVVEHHPGSRLAPAALLLAATLASRSGDEAAAMVHLKRLITSYGEAAELPQALYLLAMTGEARNQLEAAAAAYQKITVLDPAGGWADGAGDRLAELAAAGVRPPELSLTERLDRAERLLRGNEATIASEEADRIVQEAQDPGLLVRGLRLMADAARRLRRYDVAARALDMAAGRVAPERRPALRLEQGRMLIRAGQREQALRVLHTVVSAGTEAEAAEAAYIRGLTLEDMGRAAEAARVYRSVVARYPNRAEAGASLWRLGWMAWLGGDHKDAQRIWLRIGDIPGGRGHRLPALYWAARATERLSGRRQAETLYRRVLSEAPRSYYGLLAARRVTDSPATVEHGEPLFRLPDDPEQALAEDPGFARVDLLRRVGLVEFALRELEDVVMASVGDPVRLYGASGLYVRDERYHLALRILRRRFEAFAQTGHASLPRAFWEMLYPFGWRDDVTEAARRAGLDPFLVAAVIRQESAYDPRALSPAGARGLMQLMPGTAQPMAMLQGLPFGDGELLDDPRANLQLGTTFLAALLKEFGEVPLALAAYNAGPHRVRAWWRTRRTGDDMEAFIEQIPFDETRHYVKRVLLAWEEYRRIYGAQ